MSLRILNLFQYHIFDFYHINTLVKLNNKGKCFILQLRQFLIKFEDIHQFKIIFLRLKSLLIPF